MSIHTMVKGGTKSKKVAGGNSNNKNKSSRATGANTATKAVSQPIAVQNKGTFTKHAW